MRLMYDLFGLVAGKQVAPGDRRDIIADLLLVLPAYFGKTYTEAVFIITDGRVITNLSV